MFPWILYVSIFMFETIKWKEWKLFATCQTICKIQTCQTHAFCPAVPITRIRFLFVYLYSKCELYYLILNFFISILYRLLDSSMVIMFSLGPNGMGSYPDHDILPDSVWIFFFPRNLLCVHFFNFVCLWNYNFSVTHTKKYIPLTISDQMCLI